MVKNALLDILLNRKSRIYHPGEIVSGECVLNLKESLKFRSISVEFQGEAWTNWEEFESYTTEHKNTELYFHKKTVLLGNSDKKKSPASVLSPGRHDLQFSFRIPPYSLPSSFESRHGAIRYWLKARIDRPWRFDEVTKSEFHILNVVDVNCPRMLLPTFGEAQKSLNCLCNGTASPLRASMSTDRTGYSPRERILLKMQVKNLPLTQNYQSVVFLVQTVAYKGRCGKTRTERFQHKLFERSSLSWEVNELWVPDVPPTMKNCGIISISYHLKVMIVGAHCQDSGDYLEVELPIAIGTVPLRRSYSMINKMVPASRLRQCRLVGEGKAFVTIKHVSHDSGDSLPAVTI